MTRRVRESELDNMRIDRDGCASACEELRKERDELLAHCERLRKAGDLAADHRHCVNGIAVSRWERARNETPAQSLREIRAEAVEYATDVIALLPEDRRELKSFAQQIREGKE